MVKCPKCGRSSGMENFCKSCGTQLWAKCTSCGNLMTIEDAYCGNCGAQNPLHSA